MVTHFDRNLLPAAETFYRQEFSGKLTRPDRKGYAKADCPWHPSKSGKSLSVNLREGNFYCHGCQAKGGDILDFLMLRDQIPFRRAAELLGAWRDLSAEDRQRIERQKRDREKARQQELAAEEDTKRRRLEVRDLLHALEGLQKEVSDEVVELEQAHPGVESEEKDFAFGTLMQLCDQIRDCEAEYFRLAGLEERATQ